MDDPSSCLYLYTVRLSDELPFFAQGRPRRMIRLQYKSGQYQIAIVRSLPVSLTCCSLARQFVVFFLGMLTWIFCITSSQMSIVVQSAVLALVAQQTKYKDSSGDKFAFLSLKNERVSTYLTSGAYIRGSREVCKLSYGNKV